MLEPHGNHRPRGRCTARRWPTWVGAALPNLRGPWQAPRGASDSFACPGEGMGPEPGEAQVASGHAVHLQERCKISSYLFKMFKPK